MLLGICPSSWNIISDENSHLNTQYNCLNSFWMHYWLVSIKSDWQQFSYKFLMTDFIGASLLNFSVGFLYRFCKNPFCSSKILKEASTTNFLSAIVRTSVPEKKKEIFIIHASLNMGYMNMNIANMNFVNNKEIAKQSNFQLGWCYLDQTIFRIWEIHKIMFFVHEF